MVSERTEGWDAYRDDIDEPLQRPERVIARTNREYGWATIPLTGNEEEDVNAYREGGDYDPRQWGFSYGARSLLGPCRRMCEPIPQVRLNRSGLELVLLARHLIHKSGHQIMDSMTGTFPREWGVAQAQSLLAADRLSALYLLADPIFNGDRSQKLRQLDWLLDGQEPNLVVSRHCFQAVHPEDPFLAVDLECDSDRHCREHDTLPRYSAHARCYAANSQVDLSKYDCCWFEPGEYDRYWVDYPSNSSWITLERYRLRWAIEEQRPGEVHRRVLAAEAAARQGRPQTAKWSLLSTHQEERGENSNDLILSLAVDGTSVRLEVKPDKQYAVVSFWKAEVYPGYGARFSDTEIPTSAMWRSITAYPRTEVYGWATSFDYNDPESYFETAKVILTFAVTGDDVVISFESRSPRGYTSMIIPLAALGQGD